MAHLTPGDRRFLAGVSRDPVRKLDALEDALDDVARAAEASGVDVDIAAELAMLDGLESDDVAGDPDRLEGIRGELSGLAGRVRRGEVAPRDERADETAECLREIRALRAEMEAAEDPSPSDFTQEETYESE